MKLHVRRNFSLVFLLWMMVGASVVGASAQSRPLPPYNILLVTPDQMSAAFMHTYGYPSPNTPNIDQLASQGALFLRAYSAGPWTTPSFGTIFTGLFPTVHGMTLPPYQGCGSSITDPMVSGGIPQVPRYVNLSRNKPTLIEILKAQGMITAADNANCWSMFDLVDRGWDFFKFNAGYQKTVPGHPDHGDPFYLTASQTLSWAQQWLAAHRHQRFFLWVHFMEPHSPYNAPRDYDRFKTASDFPDLYPDNAKDSEKLYTLAKLGDVHAIRRLRQTYAAKILYVDQYVGELMKTVHSMGLDENTIVILVSDHGELLFSHPEDFNTADHRSLYDTDMHIPLIFRGPGIPAGKRVDALASHYDLLPTILDFDNLPHPSRVDGATLKGILSGSSSRAHPYLFGEETSIEPQYSIRDERFKLIESLRTGRIQCFDNLLDPAEQREICAEIPQKAAELKQALDQHIQAMIHEAKSYPDWEDNLALAVIEQRDSRGLQTLAPREHTVRPSRGTDYQLSGYRWSASTGAGECPGVSYWAQPGVGDASVIWRSDTPLSGEYDISICYGGSAETGRPLATNAGFMVRFKGGTLSFPIDQNQNQGRWVLLGRFRDPISVRLTNRSDGPVVAGTIRFVRVP